jgi:bifunctional UDP-N-acetylglucosamine pyrophosphorylase/glucosamine-1-phosphate N-acetyltransferase
VELKNTTLGDRTNVAHLSYLGDATLGDRVNIGAGTITANYDGVKKHRTEIGDRTKTGSNSVLVAPVTLEKMSMLPLVLLLQKMSPMIAWYC